MRIAFAVVGALAFLCTVFLLGVLVVTAWVQPSFLVSAPLSHAPRSSEATASSAAAAADCGCGGHREDPWRGDPMDSSASACGMALSSHMEQPLVAAVGFLAQPPRCTTSVGAERIDWPVWSPACRNLMDDIVSGSTACNVEQWVSDSVARHFPEHAGEVIDLDSPRRLCGHLRGDAVPRSVLHFHSLHIGSMLPEFVRMMLQSFVVTQRAQSHMTLWVTDPRLAAPYRESAAYRALRLLYESERAGNITRARLREMLPSSSPKNRPHGTFVEDPDLVAAELDRILASGRVEIRFLNLMELARGTCLEAVMPGLMAWHDSQDSYGRDQVLSDAARIALLHLYGGIWADTDVLYLSDLFPLAQALGGEWHNHNNNAFIAFRRKSRLSFTAMSLLCEMQIGRQDQQYTEAERGPPGPPSWTWNTYLCFKLSKRMQWINAGPPLYASSRYDLSWPDDRFSRAVSDDEFRSVMSGNMGCAFLQHMRNNRIHSESLWEDGYAAQSIYSRMYELLRIKET